MRKFHVTRTTIHRHLSKLIEEQLIVKTGTTRDVQYYLASTFNREYSYKITRQLSEFEVFRDDLKTSLHFLPKNVFDIIYYGFTEIFNNALDHSHGQKITVKTVRQDDRVILAITDDGIGVFKNIYDYFNLDDLRVSILELNKGKVTTEPNHHTGEGIFFNSRIFDLFEIYANNLHYVRDNRLNDWSLETTSVLKSGSRIVMSISINSTQNLTTVFQKFQDKEDLAFDRTEILVQLAQLGEETLMSRSQAKRITRGLEKFKHITLDFRGIKLVGQGFVDEIFRVYSNQYPHLTIDYINPSADVEFMIKRGLATKR
jgi:hypothetical protein